MVKVLSGVTRRNPTCGESVFHHRLLGSWGSLRFQRHGDRDISARNLLDECPTGLRVHDAGRQGKRGEGERPAHRAHE